MLEILEHNLKLIALSLASIASIYLFFSKVLPPMKRFYTRGMEFFDSMPMIQDMAKQFYPNGGSSMRDVMDRIELIGLSALERDWVNYEMDTRGVFEVDSKGQKCRVNKAWCNMTGISQEDAINGYGWINGITSLDRDRVRHEWESAIRENRTSEMEYTTATGVRVIAVATVLRNKSTGATLGWLGTLTPLN